MRQDITKDYREYMKEIGAEEKGIRVFYNDTIGVFQVEDKVEIVTVESNEIKETIKLMAE